MTRAKISQYSATANDNTDVNGVNIAEGCPPSSMNNMGREIMAALKRFQVGSDGDGVTVGGSLVVSGSTTVNTFNVDVISEKTSAAGVTVDGVLLKDSQVSTDQINEKTSAAGVTIDSVLLKDGLVGIGADGSASAPSIYRASDTNTGIFFPAADTIAFAEGGAEAMRINSSGQVGIATTNPGRILDIVSTNSNPTRITGTSSNGAYLDFHNNAATTGRFRVGQGYGSGDDNVGFLNNEANAAMVFGTNNAERARITSGGALKAKSGTAGYWNANGSYHESTNSSETEPAHLFYSTNASFVNEHTSFIVNRSASSAYQLLRCYSANAGDTEFLLRGDGNGYADGTWNNNGADYAEFFESANGEALTLGATVVLDGNKVREATDQDPATSIIGVVRPKEPSKASMVVGNTAWNKWTNKYLTDDFDRYFMEDHDVVEWVDEEGKQRSYESHAIPAGVTVPDDATRKTHDENGVKFQHYRLNPAWNPDSEYVNRENRPEWNIIGLLGQVKILKGQPVGDRWIKMRDVSETVEEWFIR